MIDGEQMTNTKNKEKLKGSIQLIKESWELYRANFKTIFYIILVPLVFSIILFLFSLINISSNNKTISLTLTFIIIAFFLIQSLLTMLATIALIVSIRNNITQVVQAYEKAVSLFLPYIWIIIFTGLIVLGGFIFFIIPGIIFAIWFMFSQYALLLEGKRGYEALKRSKELIKGRFFDVIYRIVIILLIIIFVFSVTKLLLTIIGLSLSILVGLVSVPISGVIMKVFEFTNSILYMSLKLLVAMPIITIIWMHIYDNLLKNKLSRNNKV